MKECRVNALVNHTIFIFLILNIFCIFYIIVHILHIIHIKLHVCIFPARINDGCDVHNWHVEDYRTGSSISLRADRWYQQAPASDPAETLPEFESIFGIAQGFCNFASTIWPVVEVTTWVTMHSYEKQYCMGTLACLVNTQS